MNTNEIASTQLITIEPARYVAEVYEPFGKRFEAAKTEARAVQQFDVTTKEGMDIAVHHRNIFKRIRIEAEEARVARKKPILEIGRLLDSKHKEIEAQITVHEKRFDDPIQEVLQKEKREQKASEEAAMQAAMEAERAKRAAEEKRIADANAEIERKQAEIAKAEAESRRKIEEAERAARMEREEADRKARLEREATDAEARRVARIEQDRVDAERREKQRQIDEEAARVRAEAQALEDAKRAEQARLDAIAKAEREAEEAKQREVARLANELNDGYEMLATFVRRFGKRDEFKAVAQAIGPYLKEAATK